MTFCPDFIFIAAQIIASNSVKRHQQDIAGSLIGTIITYGQSIGLGFAGTVEMYTMEGETDPVKGFRHALYFGIRPGVTSLVLDLLLCVWQPIPKKDGMRKYMIRHKNNERKLNCWPRMDSQTFRRVISCLSSSKDRY
jgi:hypothetical protein